MDIPMSKSEIGTMLVLLLKQIWAAKFVSNCKAKVGDITTEISKKTPRLHAGVHQEYMKNLQRSAFV